MKDNPIYDIYYRHHPYLFRFGSYHAIVRSLTIHGLVNRLYQSSKLNQQTYDRLLRTRQLIRTLIYYGEESVEADEAIQQINEAHGPVVASNDDFLYVLSTFFLEPIRWNNLYGNQSIDHKDVKLIIDFWCRIGKKMHINDFPKNLDDWWEFQSNYEKQFMGYSAAGKNLAKQSLKQLCKQAVPFGLGFVAKQILLGTMDEKVRVCLQLKNPVVNPLIMMKLVNRFQPNFEPKRDIVESV